MKNRNFEILYLYAFPRIHVFNYFLHVSVDILRLVCRMILTFYDRNQMSSGCLLDTQDFRFGHVTNFLEIFEKSFKSTYEILAEYSKPILNLKSQLFSLFLTYHLIGVPYGHDFVQKQIFRLGESFRYPKHVRKGLEIISKAFVKNFSAQELRKK